MTFAARAAQTLPPVEDRREDDPLRTDVTHLYVKALECHVAAVLHAAGLRRVGADECVVDREALTSVLSNATHGAACQYYGDVGASCVCGLDDLRAALAAQEGR